MHHTVHPAMVPQRGLSKTLRSNEGYKDTSLSFNHRLSNFLFTYHYTPHATTNEPPCQLFMGRMIRTRLDLLHPSDNKRVNEHQANQKQYHDKRARQRSFKVGQRVVVRDQNPRKPWVPGTIEKLQGPVTYLVRLDTGQLWRRHIDHLREIDDSSVEAASKTTETEIINVPVPIVPDSSETENNAVSETVSLPESVPPDYKY